MRERLIVLMDARERLFHNNEEVDVIVVQEGQEYNLSDIVRTTVRGQSLAYRTGIYAGEHIEE